MKSGEYPGELTYHEGNGYAERCEFESHALDYQPDPAFERSFRA